MTFFMVEGKQVGLAISDLSNIYRGLNILARSETPGDDAKANVPFHYVSTWMAFYFNTHFPVPQDLKGSRMIKYGGEGGAKYYTTEDIDKRVQIGQELRLCKEKGVTPSSAHIAPQMSSSKKRTHSLDTNGVDDNDDRNFKNIRTKEPAIVDCPPNEGDLLPTNQTLNTVEDVQGRDLGHQMSCYGDSGDMIEDSALAEDIYSLHQAELMSEEEENQFQHMKMDLESKKQKLGIFKIIF
ncbi:hypothetical protein LIER_05268 [Lithospermum erythrorhizon]|uniref:Aminotransferase-like plant mobile domain-containing protein n=1 Tax=Lithospermum erythrorhizon TaxID=34254 RepID=A0AAV3P1T0_LITER